MGRPGSSYKRKRTESDILRNFSYRRVHFWVNLMAASMVTNKASFIFSYQLEQNKVLCLVHKWWFGRNIGRDLSEDL